MTWLNARLLVVVSCAAGRGLLRGLACVALAVLVVPASHGADPNPKRPLRLVLESSAASHAGGRATLTTSALHREGPRFVGHYRIKVVPYVFKNETGTLSIAVSEEAIRKLTAGTPVTFSGLAVTSGTGKEHPVTVLATPNRPGASSGEAKISIATANGLIVFSPAYTLSGE